MHAALTLRACASNTSPASNNPTARFHRLQARTTLRGLLEAQAGGEGGPHPRPEAQSHKKPRSQGGHTQDPREGLALQGHDDQSL